MAKALGTISVTHVGLDGSTWTLLGKVKKMATPVKNNPVDATDNDDGGAKSAVYGDVSYNVDASCNYDPADPGQAILSSAAATKTPVYIRHRPRGTGTGLPQISGQAILESADIFSTEHEKIAEMAIKGSSSGLWTISTQ